MNFQKTAMVLPKMHFLLQKIHKKHRDRKIFALDRICKIKGGGKTDENSGHYVIANSRPPECRPTGTPHARANEFSYIKDHIDVIGSL